MNTINTPIAELFAKFNGIVMYIGFGICGLIAFVSLISGNGAGFIAAAFFALVWFLICGFGALMCASFEKQARAVELLEILAAKKDEELPTFVSSRG